MRLRLSKKAFYTACRTPRLRYSKLNVAPRGRVRVASALPADLHSTWFEVNHVYEDGGKWWSDDESYSVYMFVDAVLSVVFYVERGALLSVVFSIQLSVDQLRQAAGALEHAGLGRFVRDAALQSLRIAPRLPLKALGRELKALTRRRLVERAGSPGPRATARRRPPR